MHPNYKDYLAGSAFTGKFHQQLVAIEIKKAQLFGADHMDNVVSALRQELQGSSGYMVWKTLKMTNLKTVFSMIVNLFLLEIRLGMNFSYKVFFNLTFGREYHAVKMRPQINKKPKLQALKLVLQHEQVRTYFQDAVSFSQLQEAWPGALSRKGRKSISDVAHGTWQLSSG